MTTPFQDRLRGIMLSLGPGLIFAGTCIGVSHVVQSTRAGALYGFGLLWAVILANVVKFPFFEFAPRYVAATGDNLLQGYRKVGPWAFYLYFTLSLLTMFPIQSGVTLVTTGLFVNLLGWPHPPVVLSALILLGCCLILMLGKYPLLDKLMKVMIIFLGVSTIVAFLAAFQSGSEAPEGFTNRFVWDLGGISFLLALMGWMPTTLEIGVWHSFWSAERKKQTNYHSKMHEALFDFHLGYWGTMVMAVFFLSLGALVMYGTGETFAESAAGFTGQVISLYTKALGEWSKPVIVIAASTTMFSTTISCLDAFPRVIREALIMIDPKLENKKDTIYVAALGFIAVGSLIVIGAFINKMKTLIDFATILAFLSAPVFAYLNLRAVTCDHVPVSGRPPRWLIIFAWTGIAVLSGFSLYYIVYRLCFS